MVGAQAEERIFRTSPRFELVLFDRLAREDRERLADLRRNPDLYGVIRPRDGPTSRGIAASRDVALLFFTLQSPGQLPAFLLAGGDSPLLRTVEELVLDGVLEMDLGAGFVSGARAMAVVGDPLTIGRIATISREALTLAARLMSDDEPELAAVLYCWNRAPLTPAWSARIRGMASLRSFVGLDSGTTAGALGRHWTSQTDADANGWIHWSHREASDRGGRNAPTFKLYVSPATGVLPEAFAAAVSVFAQQKVPAFKLGRGVAQVTRPDKFVAYFADRERALECGTRLVEALRGLDAQGVPFTAALDEDGLVSWGVDPPAAGAREQERSWRYWVCHRLARYVVDSTRDRADAATSARFALARIRLDGVDTSTWTPDPSRLAAESRSGA